MAMRMVDGMLEDGRLAHMASTRHGSEDAMARHSRLYTVERATQKLCKMHHASTAWQDSDVLSPPVNMLSRDPPPSLPTTPPIAKP